MAFLFCFEASLQCWSLDYLKSLGCGVDEWIRCISSNFLVFGDFFCLFVCFDHYSRLRHGILVVKLVLHNNLVEPCLCRIVAGMGKVLLIPLDQWLAEGKPLTAR